MKPPVLFLNELSSKFESVQEQDAPSHVIRLVNALMAAKMIRSDLVLGSSISLPQLVFGAEHNTLAAILAGYRTELRYLILLARENPWPNMISAETVALTSEVHIDGEVALGLTWAAKEGTLAASFGHKPLWDGEEISAEKYSIDEQYNEVRAFVNIPNISSPEHAQRWRDMLAELGFEQSASSIIYRGDGFIVKMFLNDHEPTHIHVQPPDGLRTLGKLRIDTMEMLDRELPSSIKKVVMEWAYFRKSDLLRSWARCRQGLLPFTFDDE